MNIRDILKGAATATVLAAPAIAEEESSYVGQAFKIEMSAEHQIDKATPIGKMDILTLEEIGTNNFGTSCIAGALGETLARANIVQSPLVQGKLGEEYTTYGVTVTDIDGNVIQEFAQPCNPFPIREP